MTTQPGPTGETRSIGQLVSDLSEQTSRLVRAELDLAKAEIQAKAQQLGIGAGLLAAAGILALYVLAGAAITQVEHLAGLIGWRFLQGLAGCAGAVLTFAIIRDRCDMRQSAQNISLLILILGAAPVIAPLLDGCLR